MNPEQHDGDEQRVLTELLQQAGRLQLDAEEVLSAVENCSVSVKVALLRPHIAYQQERAENQQLSGALEQERTENRKCKKTTIRNTYLCSDGKSFQLPPLIVNDGIAPSNNGHNRTITIRDDDGIKKRVQLTIPKADIAECKEGVWIYDMEDVGFPTKHQDGSLITSGLGQKFFERAEEKPLEYSNECGVQAYCQQLIDDALSVLGLTETFVKTHLEVSIYMMKPDIVVVLKYKGRIMFVVEVKCPEDDKDDKKKNAVYGSEIVAGQIWSYLYAMRASGVPVPMGAIMTYNKIAIVTLDDLLNEGRHREKVQRTRDVLSKDAVPSVLRNNEPEDCRSREQSPLKVKELFVDTNCKHDDQMKNEIYIEGTQDKDINEDKENDSENEEPVPVPRRVYRSRVFEKKDVFPCLVQALHIAYQYAVEAPETKLLMIEDGHDISDRLVFCVGPSSFDWRKTQRRKNDKPFLAKVNNTIPRKGTSLYYILGKLGEGGKSTVYLACNSGGQVCAVKDLWLSPSSASLNCARDAEDDDRREKLYDKAQTEAERWRTIYGNKPFKRFNARVSYLGGKPSLIMPYGREILADRLDYVPAIRDELQRFFGLGFVYEKKDLRWRHVLLDADGKVFLCDLESLTKDINDDEAVYEQLRMLLHPMVQGKENEIKGKLQWVAGDVDSVVSCIRDDETLKAFLSVNEVDLKSDLESLVPNEKTMEEISCKAKVLLYMLAIKDTTTTLSETDSPKTHSSVPSLCNTVDHQTDKREHSHEEGQAAKRAKMDRH